MLTNAGELLVSNNNEFGRAISRRELFKDCFYIKGSQIVGHKKGFSLGNLSNFLLHSQVWFY